MSFRDAVELGVAAFMSAPDAEDGDIVGLLQSVGVADWLAERLVLWLPVAFTRHLFRDVEFSDDYTEAGVSRRASDDPVFVAAAKRATLAGRDEMEVIGLRSSEANAIQNALGAGRRLKGLRSALAVSTPLPPIRSGDGGVPEPRAVFAAFLDAHGYEVSEQPDGSYRCGELEFDALVWPMFRPNAALTQVDFVVSHPRLATPQLLESFGGGGATYRDTIRDTVEKFERGTLHVLIASLLDPTSCADQVSWEDWDHPSGTRRVCFGAQLLLYGGGDAPVGQLLDQLRGALQRQRLSGGVHAVRCYVCRDGDKTLAEDEVLLDGEPWEAGQALCAAYAWPVRTPAWGTRLFFTLSDAEDGSLPPAPEKQPWWRRSAPSA